MLSRQTPALLLFLFFHVQAHAQHKIEIEVWRQKNNISSKLIKGGTEIQEYNAAGKLIARHDPMDVQWCGRQENQYAADGHLAQVKSYYENEFRNTTGNPDGLLNIQFYDKLGRLEEEYKINPSGDTGNYKRYTYGANGLLDTAFTFYRNKKYHVIMRCYIHFYNKENKLIKKVSTSFLNNREQYHDEYRYTYSLDSNLLTVTEYEVKRKGKKLSLRSRGVYNEKGLPIEEENIGGGTPYAEYTYQYNEQGEWIVKHVSRASTDAKIAGYYYARRNHTEYRRRWLNGQN